MKAETIVGLFFIFGTISIVIFLHIFVAFKIFISERKEKTLSNLIREKYKIHLENSKYQFIYSRHTNHVSFKELRVIDRLHIDENSNVNFLLLYDGKTEYCQISLDEAISIGFIDFYKLEGHLKQLES